MHLASVAQFLPQHMRQCIEHSRYIRFRQRTTLLDFTPHVVCPYLSIVRNACMEFFSSGRFGGTGFSYHSK